MTSKLKFWISTLLLAVFVSIVALSQANGFKIDLGGGDFVVISLNQADAGFLETRGVNNTGNVTLSSITTSGISNPNIGIVAVKDGDGDNRATLFVDRNGDGGISLESSLGGADGSRTVRLGALADKEGYIYTYGPNGNNNVYIGGSGGDANNGLVAVYDSAGDDTRAGLFIDSNGDGRVFADAKHFIEDYPGRQGVKIVYASLEGPETAMYHRGRVELVNGRAVVQLPDHFTVLAALDTATVQLTPHAATSRGVAVAGLADGILEIVELNGGSGSYDVSYLVHAVRDRFRDHQVVVTDSGGGARGDSALPSLFDGLEPDDVELEDTTTAD